MAAKKKAKPKPAAKKAAAPRETGEAVGGTIHMSVPCGWTHKMAIKAIKALVLGLDSDEDVVVSTSDGKLIGLRTFRRDHLD